MGGHHAVVEPGARQAALERFERAVERPLLILALVMVPLLVIPFVMQLPPGLEAVMVGAGWCVWAAFALDYVVRLGLTDKRSEFIRREWRLLLTVVLPFLRPLRVVRSGRELRLLRLDQLLRRLARARSRRSAGSSSPRPRSRR